MRLYQTHTSVCNGETLARATKTRLKGKYGRAQNRKEHRVEEEKKNENYNSNNRMNL